MSKLDRLDPAVLCSNPRASEKAWRKYESIVIAAYRLHPKPFVYCPANMAPGTVCSRVRDAVRGALAFQFNIADGISTQDLFRWYDEVVIRHDHEKVYIGEPTQLKSILEGRNLSTPSPTLFFPTLSFEELTAFCILLSTERIRGPVHVQQPPDTSLIGERPNVHLLHKDDGSLVIF